LTYYLDGQKDPVWDVANKEMLADFIREETQSENTNAERVVQIIREYNLDAAPVGNTVTVTGTKTNAATTLDLGDISGLTIDWKATLSGAAPNIASESFLIQFSGEGDFNITGGKITLEPRDYWTRAIVAEGGANVTLSGGEIEGLGVQDTGIDISGDGTLTISGGKLTIPNGNGAFANTISITNTSGVTGVICDTSPWEISAYGTVTTTEDSELFYEEGFSDNWDNMGDVTYIAKDGAIWNIEGVTSDSSQRKPKITLKIENGGTMNLKSTHLKFKGILNVEEPNGELNLDENSSITIVGGTATSGGTININGTLTNLDRLINNGTINNYSGNTLDNQGTLTNNGTINNTSTGSL
jgi:hypothetical protein